MAVEGAGGAPHRIRVWLVGFGTVGQWLARSLLDARGGLLDEGIELAVIGVATARDGFVGDPDGIDLAAAADLRSRGRSLRELAGAECFATALDGMRATEADVLVEAGLSPAGGESGLTHMREALERRIAVVASNKWPVAVGGAELSALARARGAQFRAESTVMSGTPVVGPLTEGLAGARLKGLRGVLNATNNFICTRISEGATYDEALARAQELGLAEPDPSADVDGLDTASKLMVLSALALGRPLALSDVDVTGISELDDADFKRAARRGRVVREVASLDSDGAATVAPVELPQDDFLAGVIESTNAIECTAEPLGSITITGPGAGPALAGQGVLSDLFAVARELRRSRARRDV